MQSEIHPEFFTDAVVKCACGVEWQVGTTVREMFVETCGRCHPHWTGEQRIVDTEGRVERFLKRYNMELETEPAKAEPAAGDK